MSALDGIKVLDISEIMQAPLAAMMLADFGADVTKVERPGVGDMLRPMDRYAAQNGLMSSYYASLNRNKRSITLDLKSEGGRKIFLEMARKTDVLIHNYRPGAMERLGLDYDTLSAINPRLIYAVATAFGESGPLSSKAGQDMLAQTISGITYATTQYLGQPALLSTPLIDLASGMTLAQGIAFALLERERSGLGQKVSVSLFDTALAGQMVEAASILMYGNDMNWIKNALSFVFETSDGWITVLGFFRENPLQRVCQALGIPDIASEPEFSTLEKQVKAKDEIYARLKPAFLSYTTEECTKRLDSVDILCAPVQSLKNAMSHVQCEINGMIAPITVDGQGTLRTLASPLKLSRTPAKRNSRVAALGADTLAILDELGIEGDAVEALARKGAFGPTPPFEETAAS